MVHMSRVSLVVLVGPTRCLRSVLLVGHPFAQAATEGSALSVMFQAAKADYNFPATGMQQVTGGTHPVSDS